ncbi:MAG TPA: DUF4926 domain-containing protein [Verrucomicrobiae bacterium]|jgi:hypothetical protein
MKLPNGHRADLGSKLEEYSLKMNNDIHMHDVVVLLDDMPAKHFETGQPLMLRRGQVGTVVMTYDGPAFEVEFAGRDGRAYALLPVAVEKLMPLKDMPELVPA